MELILESKVISTAAKKVKIANLKNALKVLKPTTEADYESVDRIRQQIADLEQELKQE
jgi:polyhydroxyalkanoate synthesis regulator phasin